MSNSKIVSWNSGRYYTKSGQRMAATKVRLPHFPYSGIVFIDIDRGISGFMLSGHEVRADDVMSAYDRNQWTQASEYEFPELEACREAAAKVAPVDGRPRF